MVCPCSWTRSPWLGRWGCYFWLHHSVSMEVFIVSSCWNSEGIKYSWIGFVNPCKANIVQSLIFLHLMFLLFLLKSSFSIDSAIFLPNSKIEPFISSKPVFNRRFISANPSVVNLLSFSNSLIAFGFRTRIGLPAEPESPSFSRKSWGVPSLEPILLEGSFDFWAIVLRSILNMSQS